MLTILFVFVAFQAPEEPSGMQALLAHSVQTYGPLPSDLRSARRVRSRTSSRASPYPQQSRNANSSFGDSPQQTRLQRASSNKTMMTATTTITPPSFVHTDPYANANTANSAANTPKSALTTPVLRELGVNPNLTNMAKGNAPSIEALKPFSPLVFDGLDSAVKVKANSNNNNNNTIRPRVGSTARRTALGWSKRSTGPPGAPTGVVNGGKKSSTTSTDQKENSIVVVGSGSGAVMMTCVIFSFFFCH